MCCDKIIESNKENPAFFKELKGILKKSPSFRSVYDKDVKPFLFSLLEFDGCHKAKNQLKKLDIVSDIVLLKKEETFEMVKFRVRFQGKGSSESPRIYVAVAFSKRAVIPLTIYTHGDKKGEPTAKELETRFIKVLRQLC